MTKTQLLAACKAAKENAAKANRMDVTQTVGVAQWLTFEAREFGFASSVVPASMKGALNRIDQLTEHLTNG